MYKNAIFDVDGTIINSYKDVTGGICYALEKLGYSRPEESVLKKFIGPTVYESMTQILKLPHEVASEIITIYRGWYETIDHSGTVMYPGFPDLLDRLKKEGVRLSLASTKPTRFIPKIFDKFGITHYFEKIIGATDEKSASDKTVLIEKARLDESAVMIGDRKFDIAAATKLNIDSIGVTYGFMEEDEFIKFPPTYIARNTDEIFEIIINKG